MDDITDLTLHAAEFIKDRLYFVTLKEPKDLESTEDTAFFTIDTKYRYLSFNSDFGPLCLAVLYRYCYSMNKRLAELPLTHKLVHYTTLEGKRRVNEAFLIGSYAVIYLGKSPDETYDLLASDNSPPFVCFRDASKNKSYYNLHLGDCLHAIHKALKTGLLDFETFDVFEYEFHYKIENGDLNWIVPNKIMAFCNPHSESTSGEGEVVCTPESYLPYFKKYNVTTVIRLNGTTYDKCRFTNQGLQHFDLYFRDGYAPPDDIMMDFLEITENAKGAVAVHCKAGLGRTGTLIACYIMKHYNFTTGEAIAWTRICRPGSVLAKQQNWLESKERRLWRLGKKFREGATKIKIEDTDEDCSSSDEEDEFPTDIDENNLKPNEMKTSTKCTAEDASIKDEINYACDSSGDGECSITQGDELNRIKAFHHQRKSHMLHKPKLHLEATSRCRRKEQQIHFQYRHTWRLNNKRRQSHRRKTGTFPPSADSRKNRRTRPSAASVIMASKGNAMMLKSVCIWCKSKLLTFRTGRLLKSLEYPVVLDCLSKVPLSRSSYNVTKDAKCSCDC